MKTRASARVVVTVEIPVGSTWGSDCTLAQVYRQAAEASRARVQTALQEGRVVKTVVTAVVCEEEQ